VRSGSIEAADRRRLSVRPDCESYARMINDRFVPTGLQRRCNVDDRAGWRAREVTADRRRRRPPATLRPSLTAGPVRPADRSGEAGKEAKHRVSARPPSPSGRWPFHVKVQ
jgi:hypothetical protein